MLILTPFKNMNKGSKKLFGRGMGEGDNVEISSPQAWKFHYKLQLWKIIGDIYT